MTKISNVRAHTRKGTKGVRSHTRELEDKKVSHDDSWLYDRRSALRNKTYRNNFNKYREENEKELSYLRQLKRQDPDKFNSSVNNPKLLARAELLHKYYLGSYGKNPPVLIADKDRERAYQTQMVLMSPEEFLSLATHNVAYSDKALRKYKHRLKNAVPIEPLDFDVDINTFQVSSHEGRHRAKAASSLGVTQVPVILHHVRGYRGVEATKDIDVNKLISQRINV